MAGDHLQISFLTLSKFERIDQCLSFFLLAKLLKTA